MIYCTSKGLPDFVLFMLYFKTVSRDFDPLFLLKTPLATWKRKNDFVNFFVFTKTFACKVWTVVNDDVDTQFLKISRYIFVTILLVLHFFQSKIISCVSAWSLSTLTCVHVVVYYADIFSAYSLTTLTACRCTVL